MWVVHLNKNKYLPRSSGYTTVESCWQRSNIIVHSTLQIAFTTPQDSYDAYRVFQMFNFYTRVCKTNQRRNFALLCCVVLCSVVLFCAVQYCAV